MKNVLINIEGIQEIYVRSLSVSEKDERDYDYALVVTHEERALKFHGTKSDCEGCYNELRRLLDSEKKGIVGTFTFSSEPPEDETL